ncbi:GNAT family N-acetyltransferase [Alteribacter aurantiacus]|uniref:GNAT family N-acetyltransferase n=1 Tax=Alteribacter aurantiacus TaxID=254410 RepID=UPI000421C0F9|nr:GNAT family N-acetyltransferase [Alteribacter aurantiacus]
MFEWNWMTKDDAIAIAKWEYEEPYHFYNMTEDEDDLEEWLNPFNWKHTLVAYKDGELVGFATFRYKANNEVEVSLGMRPDLTGKGFGRQFVEQVNNEACHRYRATCLIVNVAAFNERAIAVYERAGYRKVAAFLQQTNHSNYPFVKLKKRIHMEASK